MFLVAIADLNLIGIGGKNMNKKALIIFSLLMVVLSTTAISAFDLNGWGNDSQDEKVTIEGIDFNIPAGYTEDEDLAVDGQVNETNGIEVTTWSKTFSVSDDDFVSIAVAEYDGVEVDDSIPEIVGQDAKTVNGIDGYDYSFGPMDGITYAKDGKLVIVMVMGEISLEDVIIN